MLVQVVDDSSSSSPSSSKRCFANLLNALSCLSSSSKASVTTFLESLSSSDNRQDFVGIVTLVDVMSRGQWADQVQRWTHHRVSSQSSHGIATSTSCPQILMLAWGLTFLVLEPDCTRLTLCRNWVCVGSSENSLIGSSPLLQVLGDSTYWKWL